MKTKKLVTSAMLLTFAFMLSMIQLFPLRFGGGITPVSMLPIIVIGYAYGIKWGLFSSLAYSLLQLIAGMNNVSAFYLPGESHTALIRVIHICLIDYVGAYTVLGFGALFRDKLKSKYTEICLGAIVSVTFRYIMHIISGTIFFGAWAQWFFSDPTGLSQISVFSGFCDFIINNVGGNALALVYSVIYNGFYMIPEIIITASAAPIVLKVIHKSRYLS